MKLVLNTKEPSCVLQNCQVRLFLFNQTFPLSFYTQEIFHSGEKKNSIGLRGETIPWLWLGPGRGWSRPECKNGFSKVTTPLEKCLKNGGVICRLGSIGSNGSWEEFLRSTCFVQKQNKRKNKQEKNEGEKRKLFPEMDFPLGAGISDGIYLSIPLPGHGTWIGEHWKVE